ncbi:phosphoenolpyruvate carboxykinase (ATP) [Rufibacter glacialis]|uniref:Phosphoenolpyruvate carboxykinase (ATP) n=1 Tax=Rufibacter glacialis TaxID=1259555 RepID=A0A5M8QH70_9BACT|nr:phosphoenolpyruvate carboxykinase (ATP) [Rufibacter glacialis]KAA6435389.1 phosphoenolpyruvate carboxykinase (ATP) [Rufibacter glacialis]GGK62985.1 phosphoenolpyruvate carboxykinase [ATP] 1 [Rufibacter glacialis]
MRNHERRTTAVEALLRQENPRVFWNLSPAELVEEALKNGEGTLADTGALVCSTGAFTGRSPKDRFIVRDEKTGDTVWWSEINQPFAPEAFDRLLNKMTAFLQGQTLYVRDAYAGAHPDYRLNLRVINTHAYHNLFCANLFLRPTLEELSNQVPEFTILCAPDFKANPQEDGTRQENFAVINLSQKLILIGGTAYTGEMKKGIFSVLNYLLPQEHGVLSMHCSANVGEADDTAIFFGLSGTGKTTLSTDPHRRLIGDDEHGWTQDSVFNFEGGCYAKVIDLTRAQEPEIWDAIRFGAIVENTNFLPGTRTVDYTDSSLTENTRTAYPIHHIPQVMVPSRAGTPKNIFFLTADAFGILPPISRLNPSQAMYYFISGYTAKVAGTEVGVTEPKATFSACFGEAFLPLHPAQYAQLLGEKLEAHDVNVWLVNTGWTGGPFGEGTRMKLSHTRAMVSAALNGDLEEVTYIEHPVFGVKVPQTCPRVPAIVLNPRDTWTDKRQYDLKAQELAALFVRNFQKYAANASDAIKAGAPLVAETV